MEIKVNQDLSIMAVTTSGLKPVRMVTMNRMGIMPEAILLKVQTWILKVTHVFIFFVYLYSKSQSE